MIRQTPQADLFIQPLRDALRRETRGSRAIKIAKHDNVYTCGEQGEAVYFLLLKLPKRLVSGDS